jgi:hypothetical protein
LHCIEAELAVLGWFIIAAGLALRFLSVAKHPKRKVCILDWLSKDFSLLSQGGPHK